MTGDVTLRDLREDDLPAIHEIQRDADGRRMAAFTTETAPDRETFVAKHRQYLADPAIVMRAVEVGGELVGSVGAYPIEGDLEVTYWIRRDRWGQGIATAALAALLREVTARPLHARVAEGNPGSVRVLQRNGFVQTGSDDGFAAARGATVTELIFELPAGPR